MMSHKLFIYIVFIGILFQPSYGFVYKKPTKEQLHAIHSVKTIRVIIDTSDNFPTGVTLPFEDETRRFLNYAGINTVKYNSDHFDATLVIKTKGEALGANYASYSSKPMDKNGNIYIDGRYVGIQYTGASISGSISIVIPGIPVYKRNFKGIRVPSRFSSGNHSEPASAPFHSVFINSFIKSMIEIIGDVWGTEPLYIALKNKADVWYGQYMHELVSSTLVNLLKNEVDSLILLLKYDDPYVQVDAARALEKTKDPRVIVYLINLLKEKDSYIRENAAISLGRITGEHFGTNSKAWEKWWEIHENNYLK